MNPSLRAKWILFPILAVGCTFVPMQSSAQVDHYKVKAAFLVTFTRYVEWPEMGKGSSFVIGVLGSDPFRGELERIAREKAVDGRRIVIQRVSWATASSANLLFIPQSESGNLTGLQKIAKLPILTVGESNEFCKQGGMVGFNIANQNVGFEINATVAKNVGISISSQLLKLASAVR